MDQQSPEAQPPKPPSKPAQSVEGSVKDTIESILVAFMLAFIFRAFVVEAFVIPTGSMAPTLLGAHMRFRCPDCGYRFDTNFQGRDVGNDEIQIDSTAGERKFHLFCPNCGFRLRRFDANDTQNDSTNVPVRYGDRILVLKYLYLLEEPSRWDVVVFKSPVDPARNDYQQNYIKRLVGLPGETVMILDGDVYVGKGTDVEKFQVQSKPRKVQDALWRIVYDDDYQPQGLDRSSVMDRNNVKVDSDQAWQHPWKPADAQPGWTVGDAKTRQRGFVFNNQNGPAALQFDPEANPRMYAFTDWLAYDVTDGQFSDLDNYARLPLTPDSNVSDVKIDFYYQRKQGDGPLRVHITKFDRKFEAVLNQSSAMLMMDDKPVAPSVTLPSGSSPIHVQLMNVDYRASLVIDGKEVAATTREQYSPDLRYLLDAFKRSTRLPKPSIQLIGDRQTCEITHLSLWRDVYYRNSIRNGTPMQWATPFELPHRLMQLNEDEFFVLGDNSQVSLDARYWEEPITLPRERLYVEAGRVPRRFMLGKAFFVYWPAGYRPVEADRVPALIPDFGDMRFIH